jgi:hypothetical protein
MEKEAENFSLLGLRWRIQKTYRDHSINDVDIVIKDTMISKKSSRDIMRDYLGVLFHMKNKNLCHDLHEYINKFSIMEQRETFKKFTWRMNAKREALVIKNIYEKKYLKEF